MNNIFLTSIIFFLIFFSCKNSNSKISEKSNPTSSEKPKEKVETPSNAILLSNSNFQNNYFRGNAPQTSTLGLALKEISGLSYFSKTNQLLAINDERGFIFFINPKNGKKENTVRFGGGGDYEGVELVDEKIGVIKSNGDIYFYDLESKEGEKRIKTKLNASNDVEGLAYDSDRNELLIACKGNPNLDKNDKYKKVKNIYAFNLEKNKIKKTPFLSVADSLLENFVKEKTEGKDFSKKELKRLRKRAKDFSPSGIAIHPISKNYYLLSSQGKTLMIFDTEKKLQAIIFLDEKIHAQPEGICFSPSSELFISNEGKGISGAKLMRYNFLK